MTLNKSTVTSTRLDVIGLLLAGLINTVLATLDAGLILMPGTPAGEIDTLLRINWITENTLRWQAGWLFWFAVTLSFSWSYYALGRHLNKTRSWVNLAIGLAIIAAAIDIVGVLINLVVLPELAQGLINASSTQTPTLIIMFSTMESLSNALTNVAAFSLYSVAGLLLLPAIFSTEDYPPWLRWLGISEWSIATLASILLVVAPPLATIPLLVSFMLFAPWIWGSALWLHRRDPEN